MGCDGGTIPRRDELVKTKKKPEQKDKDAERLYRWKHCSLAQTPLQHPIVACELGRLYNKEEVISRLLSKAKEAAMSHIKSLKDIKELILTRNPSFREDIPKGDKYFDSQTSEYMCPITSQEMNGKSRFYFIWTCGCVISERALKEIKSDRCHVCNKNFLQTDVISINPSDSESKSLETQMNERREKKKMDKKEKRKLEDGSLEQKKKKKTDNEGPSTSKSSTGNNVSSDLLRNDALKEASSSSKFSISKDASKSDVFKSIFDSHKSAKNKPQSHWVTCNPQYF